MSGHIVNLDALLAALQAALQNATVNEPPQANAQAQAEPVQPAPVVLGWHDTPAHLTQNYVAYFGDAHPIIGNTFFGLTCRQSSLIQVIVVG